MWRLFVWICNADTSACGRELGGSGRANVSVVAVTRRADRPGEGQRGERVNLDSWRDPAACL